MSNYLTKVPKERFKTILTYSNEKKYDLLNEAILALLKENHNNSNNNINIIEFIKSFLKNKCDNSIIEFIKSHLDSFMNDDIFSWCFDFHLLSDKGYIKSLLVSFDKWVFPRYDNCSSDEEIANINNKVCSILKHLSDEMFNDYELINIMVKYEFNLESLKNFFSKMNSSSISHFLCKRLENKKDVCVYFKALKLNENSDLDKFIKEHIDLVLSNALDVYRYISAGLFSGNEDYIYKKMDKDRNFFLDCICGKTIVENRISSFDSSFKEKVGAIVDEICNEENINEYSKIQYYGYDSGSRDFIIGSKIFRIGTSNVTPHFSDCSHESSVILKRDFEVNGIRFFIEVANFVDKKCAGTFTDDKVNPFVLSKKY